MKNKIKSTIIATGLTLGASGGMFSFFGGVAYLGELDRKNTRQEYYLDHVTACKETNQRFLDAREQHQKFRRGELTLHSDPAISSLEEMASQKLYNCDSITSEESCESIEHRFPLIIVNNDHYGRWVNGRYFSEH